MDLSVLRKKNALALGGLLALTVCAGNMQAIVLSGSATSLTIPTVAVTCNTLTGPGAAQSLTVHASGAATGFSITVGVVPTAGVKVTPPAAVLLNSTTNTAGIVFSVQAAAGCASSTVASINAFSVQLTTTIAGVTANDVSAAVNDTVASTTATALVSANVSITCSYNASGPVYIPGSPVLVSVTSAANLGTPFTVNTSGLPAWLVLGPSAPFGTAGTTAANFTVAASPGSATTACGGNAGFGGTTKTFSLQLLNPPALPQTVTVTLTASTPTPLTVTPVPAAPSIAMQYTKLSGNPAVANASVTSTLANAVFFVNQATVPGWLTVNPGVGTVPSGGKALQLATTSEADTLAPGNYTATVFLQVTGYADTPIVITLLVTNKPPKLSVTSANPMAVTYTLGSALPVTTINVASSDSPIPYTITLGGALQPQLASGQQLTGIAYSFGSNIVINYNATTFSTAAPGTVLSGTVTFSYGTNPVSVLVVTINLTIASPGAIITSISPATLPTAAPGTVFHVTVLGSGFVGGLTPTQMGIATVSNPSTLNVDSNLFVTYNNPGNLDLRITVVSADNANLPFSLSGAGGAVYLGANNGGSIPTGTATLTIGAGPIIYGVTSSSSFTEVSGGNLPQVAPYDMISIFGSSFCASAGTGCSSTQILNGIPDTVYSRFPFALSPDVLPVAPLPDIRRQLAVTFYPHGTLSGGLPAPLLFATNGQINAIVPGAVTAAPTEYDIVVSFGCPLCSPSTVVNSVPYPVNTVATDPGIFTVGSDGQGPAAALASGTYALINSVNPAGMRSGLNNNNASPGAVTNSDTIQLYVTGLGLPAAGSVYTSNDGTCIGALSTGYLAALNLIPPVSTFANIDGAVIQTSLFSGTDPDLPPCLTAEPTVTIGGVPSPTVTYAAFTGNTVAGLYQINVQLPSSVNTLYPNFPSLTGPLTNLTAPTQLPIFVTAGGLTTQAGVMLSVAPRLSVAAPVTLTLPAVGGSYTSGNAVIATLGSGTYTYALTSGVLPAGLTLSPSAGTITGSPADGAAGTSAQVTVTATDTSVPPLTGAVTFTLVVPGGLSVTSSGAGPFSASVYGTGGVSLPTITGHGAAPLAYAITTSTLSSAPAGMTVPSGVFTTAGSTSAGTYLVTVTATDADGVKGSFTFTDTIALEATPASLTPSGVSVSGSPVQIVTTVAVLGYSGTGGTPLTCIVNGANAAKFTCADAGGTVTISTVSATTLTATTPYAFTVTVTDTATASGAVAGAPDYATAQTVSITLTPGA